MRVGRHWVAHTRIWGVSSVSDTRASGGSRPVAGRDCRAIAARWLGRCAPVRCRSRYGPERNPRTPYGRGPQSPSGSAAADGSGMRGWRRRSVVPAALRPITDHAGVRNRRGMMLPYRFPTSGTWDGNPTWLVMFFDSLRAWVVVRPLVARRGRCGRCLWRRWRVWRVGGCRAPRIMSRCGPVCRVPD